MPYAVCAACLIASLRSFSSGLLGDAESITAWLLVGFAQTDTGSHQEAAPDRWSGHLANHDAGVVCLVTRHRMSSTGVPTAWIAG